MLFRHIMVGSNDLDRSKKFYDATFKALGINEVNTDPKGRLVYKKDGELFVITKPIDGKPATAANGGTLGLVAESEHQVNEWHKAGLAHGGTAIEDPPGLRGNGKLYLAYLRDPDGNKLCAVYTVK